MNRSETESNEFGARDNLSAVLSRLIRVVRKDLNSLDELIKKSDLWIDDEQMKGRQNRKKRCEYMIKLMQQAIHEEEQRELKLLKIDPRSIEQVKKQFLIERFETADKLMKLLEEHKLVNGSELANYLRYTLELSKRIGAYEPKNRNSSSKNDQCKAFRDVKRRYSSVKNVCLSTAI